MLLLLRLDQHRVSIRKTSSYLNIVSLLLLLLRLFGDGRATVYVAVVVVVQQQQLLLETRRSQQQQKEQQQQQQRSLKECESVGGWSENKYRTIFYLCSASLVFKLQDAAAALRQLVCISRQLLLTFIFFFRLDLLYNYSCTDERNTNNMADINNNKFLLVSQLLVAFFKANLLTL